MDAFAIKPFYGFVKRVLDMVISALALIVLAVPMLVIAILVRRDGGRAIYAQARVGKNGKTFHIYKFRSMKPNAERLEDFLTPEELAEYKKEYKLANDPRITRIGNVLRKSSLDELPQLINILRGDMSLVGPRPLLESELKGNYTEEEQKRLLSVRPGLTGYWQAAFRNESSYQTGDRQQQELYYIGRVTFAMDVKILLMTVKRVFSGKGAA